MAGGEQLTPGFGNYRMLATTSHGTSRSFSNASLCDLVWGKCNASNGGYQFFCGWLVVVPPCSFFSFILIYKKFLNIKNFCTNDAYGPKEETMSDSVFPKRNTQPPPDPLRKPSVWTLTLFLVLRI